MAPPALAHLFRPRDEVLREYWDLRWNSRFFESERAEDLAWAWKAAFTGGFEGLQAHELDKLLPRNPNDIEVMLNAPFLDIATKAKVLQVVLARGGSYPTRDLEIMAASHLGPLSRDEALERITYQHMAMKAVLMSDNGGDLFREISTSGDALPTHRLPATQFMHVMLQDGGLLGSFEGQERMERWIKGVPNEEDVEKGVRGIKDPETAGRAMRHIFDAAYRKDAGGGYTLSGYVELSAGPVTFGVSTGTSQGDHWDDVTANLNPGVGKWFGEQDAAAKQAIAQGYLGSDYSFDKSAAPSAKN